MNARRLIITAVTVLAGQLLVVPNSFGQELLRADDRERDMWQQRVLNALEEEQTSRLALAEAEAIYSRGRSRHTLRGDERATALERIEALSEEHEQALRTLKELPEEARRAGALPGWLRDAQDRFERREAARRMPNSETTTAPPASVIDAADGADSSR